MVYESKLISVDWSDVLPDEVDTLDEDAAELLEIKEYFDELVEDGCLNEDYSLNEECNDCCEELEELQDQKFVPEKGEEYWLGDRFDFDAWEEDFSDHVNLLKLASPNSVIEIQSILGYSFINENILRQAFTRRSFGLGHNVGNSEQLEFFGDAVLNTVVTREIARQLTKVKVEQPEEPFQTQSIHQKNVNNVNNMSAASSNTGEQKTALDEGDFTRIRNSFINKEFLSGRATELGLDRFILYGATEEPSESAKEDAVEALIGAVAIDCDWDWSILERVVDNLICLQITTPDLLRTTTFYDLFNAWHQKHFSWFPQYEVYKNGRNDRNGSGYACALRFAIPDNSEGLNVKQRINIPEAETRSKARELAAEFAYRFVVKHDLWANKVEDSGITPEFENAINQLQELKQKGYVSTAPDYEFSESTTENDAETGSNVLWHCKCTCEGLISSGTGETKVKAKKEAALMILNKLFSKKL